MQTAVLEYPEFYSKQDIRKKLLKTLTYEMVKGKPIYYRGYRQVLRGVLSPEAVMGSSYIQSLIVSILHVFLFQKLRKKYNVLSNELGVLIEKGSWRACDIAIYNKNRLKNHPPDDHYIPIPPDVVIEIDTKAELYDFENSMSYFNEKRQQLHDFGVEKIIWIMTAEPRKIVVSDTSGIWQIVNWDEEIRVIEDCAFNLKHLLEEEN